MLFFVTAAVSASTPRLERRCQSAFIPLTLPKANRWHLFSRTRCVMVLRKKINYTSLVTVSFTPREECGNSVEFCVDVYELCSVNGSVL